MTKILKKLTLLLCFLTPAFAQVTISGTQQVASGSTHTITLTANDTVTGISVVGSSTVLTINGSFTLTNSDSTNGTVLNGGTINGSGTLSTSFIDVSNSGSLNISNLTITGSQSDALTFGTGVNNLTLSGGGSGAINLGGGNDNLFVTSTYTGNLDGGAGTNTLTLNGGTVSGTLSNFNDLTVTTNSGVLNSNLSVGTGTISAELTGTGNLTFTDNVVSTSGHLNISGALTLQAQTNHLTLGDNVTTVNVNIGSHSEGNITLGSGATNATVTIRSISGAGYTYSGNLTGSGDDNLTVDNLSFNNTLRFTGTITGFDSFNTIGRGQINLNSVLGGNQNQRVSLTTNSTNLPYLINRQNTYYFSTFTLGNIINSSGDVTVDIAGAITTSSSNSISIKRIILSSGASGVIYFGINTTDVIFDGVSYSDNLIFSGSAFAQSENITLRNGASLSSSITNASRLSNFTVSGTGTNILDTDLSPTGNTTISGLLQIASGHTLTTKNGQTNQVQSGGTLDISQLGQNVAGIGSNGITIVAGGTLVAGTEKNRNASNITLTRGASSSTSSTITLDLGTNSVSSSSAIFSTLPTLTGTGTIGLAISGSLANAATQVFASGDVTADYRIDSGGFVLRYNGSATLIENSQISVTSVTIAGDSEREVTLGDSPQTLVATIAPSNAGNQAVTWSSSNDDVATVSNNGVVTFVAGGQATITVTTASGGFTDTVMYTVRANLAPTSVSLSNQINSLSTTTTARIFVADIVIADDDLGSNTITLAGSSAIEFEVENNKLYFKARSTTGTAIEEGDTFSVTINVADSTVTGSNPVTVDFTLTIINNPFTQIRNDSSVALEESESRAVATLEKAFARGLSFRGADQEVFSRLVSRVGSRANNKQIASDLTPKTHTTYATAVQDVVSEVVSRLGVRNLAGLTNIGKTPSPTGPSSLSREVRLNAFTKEYAWVDFTFSSGSFDGSSLSPGYDNDATATRLGYESFLESVFLGISLSYDSNTVDYNQNLSLTKLNTLSLGFYGSYQKDNSFYLASVVFSDVKIEGRRQRALLDNVATQSSASSLDLVLDYGLSRKAYIYKVGFRYNITSVDDIRERGGLGNNTSGESYNSLYLKMGVSRVWWLGTKKRSDIALFVDLAYNLLDVERNVTTSFSASADTFEVAGTDVARTSLAFSTVYKYEFDKVTYEAGISYRFSSQSSNFGLTAKARYSF